MSDPVAPFTAASFQRGLAEHRLMGTRCTECGAVHLPPRAICAHCRSDAQEWIELSGRGTLAAFTSIFVAPSALVAEGYDRANPYVTGIVALEEGPHFSARILGVDARQPDLAWIGRPVAATFLDRGEAGTLLAFEARQAESKP
jgi:uncharacterized protein